MSDTNFTSREASGGISDCQVDHRSSCEAATGASRSDVSPESEFAGNVKKVASAS